MRKGHKTLSCSYATEEGLWPGVGGGGGGELGSQRGWDGGGGGGGGGSGVAAVPKGRNAVMIREEELTKLISTPRRSVCGFVAFVRASAARALWPYGVWFVSLLHKRFKTFFFFFFLREGGCLCLLDVVKANFPHLSPAFLEVFVILNGVHPHFICSLVLPALFCFVLFCFEDLMGCFLI